MEKPSFNHLDLRSKIEDVKQDLRSYEIKTLVEKAGLANDKFKPYHCKCVKDLGPTKYLALADMANKAKNPAMLMSWLLKQELSK